MEYTRATTLPLIRTLTYELMKRKRISARPTQTVELKFNAVGRGRLVSTCVEKDALTETYSCPGEGRDWASTPHSGEPQFHGLNRPRRYTLAFHQLVSQGANKRQRGHSGVLHMDSHLGLCSLS